MKKSIWQFAAAALLALLFVMGCPQEPDDKKPSGIPDKLVTSISIAGIKIDPLPQPSSSMAGAAAASVVVNTERPPLENEDPNRVHYRPAQPVTVKLANVNQTAYFEVTRPGEEPFDIVLTGTQDKAEVTRTIGIILPNEDNFQVGQDVWIKVVAADESKTEYYRVNVINQTHDTAINSITVGGYDVLDPTQTAHIGPWLTGSSWEDAADGLINLRGSETSGVTVAASLRNHQFDLARPVIEYAKIPAAQAAGAGEPSAWSATAPSSYDGRDILAVKVTASNKKTVGFMKITINVGGSPFLSSLKVNNQDILNLAAPSVNHESIRQDVGTYTVAGAYRVEEGQTLTSTPVTWAVTPVAADSNASVSWTIVGKGQQPQTWNNPTSFSASSNYLFIRVVSANSDYTRYYLVVYDERPKIIEHVKTATKCVPIYRFTLPSGITWGQLGNYPKIRITILQEEAEYNQTDGYQRNFILGEISRMTVGNDYRGPALEWDPDNLSILTGGSTFNTFMPFLINRRVKDWAMDIPNNTPAPDIWFTIEYPLDTPDSWRAPWDPNAGTKPVINNNYIKELYWPGPETTGDVYFGVGITFDGIREYWIKEISLVSENGNIIVPCDLLGNGRIDSDNRETGFVRVDPVNDTVQYLREMVADPTLK